MSYNDILHHLSLGFVSSFISTLPLGMLNLTVLQLSVADRQNQAVTLSLGATMIEFFQIGLTLLGLNVLSAMPQLNNIFSIISIPILLYLAIQNLKKGADTEGGQLRPESAFYQGIILSLSNVVIYPFWFLWGTIFVQYGWLTPTPMAYFYFAFAAAVGTFCSFSGVIVLGKLFCKRLPHLQNIINPLIEFTFLGFAVCQFYAVLAKMYR